MSDKLSEEELLEWLGKQCQEAGWNIRWNPQDNIDLQAYQQIVALIKKPEITEEWKEERARELFSKTCQYMRTEEEAYFEVWFKDFIRKLYEEMPAKKATVSEAWIQEMAEDTANDYPDVAFPNLITIFKNLLIKAGVEVKE